MACRRPAPSAWSFSLAPHSSTLGPGSSGATTHSMRATTSTALRRGRRNCAFMTLASMSAAGAVSTPGPANPKTFFFYNMEWRRYISGGNLSPTVPLASIYPDANGADTGSVLAGYDRGRQRTSSGCPERSRIWGELCTRYAYAWIAIPQQHHPRLRHRCECEIPVDGGNLPRTNQWMDIPRRQQLANHGQRRARPHGSSV